MKTYKVTTLTDYGRKFVRTVTARSEGEAISKVLAEMAWNEIPAFVEEV